MLGPWAGAGRADETVSVLAGLRDAWPEAEIEAVTGTPIEGGEDAGIAAAVAAARRADTVLLCLGEAASMSGEAASRARIDLPGRQAELAEAVLEVGRPVVALVFSGRPIAMTPVFERAAAVVACWFPGSMAGHAVADLVTGRIAPSARLAVTWPRHVGQVPIFFAARTGGRPENPLDRFTSKYLDLPSSPQFAFGHGLGFGPVEIGPPEILAEDGGISVRAEVTNPGTRAELATVFLFLRDPVAAIPRPALELRNFRQVLLEPGERREVAFRITRAALGYLGPDLTPVFEPGAFVVRLGLTAEPAGLRGSRVHLG
jgi:beta-glucosidase